MKANDWQFRKVCRGSHVQVLPEESLCSSISIKKPARTEEAQTKIPKMDKGLEPVGVALGMPLGMPLDDTVGVGRGFEGKPRFLTPLEAKAAIDSMSETREGRSVGIVRESSRFWAPPEARAASAD
jgi:hypothetical protein